MSDDKRITDIDGAVRPPPEGGLDPAEADAPAPGEPADGARSEDGSGPSGDASEGAGLEGEVSQGPGSQGPGSQEGVSEGAAEGGAAGEDLSGAAEARAEPRGSEPSGRVVLPEGEWSDLLQRAKERDAYREELLRARAELDNYRKLVRRERPTWEDHAVRRSIAAILPVLDNFERALESSRDDDSDAEGFRRGVEMIHQLLVDALRSSGVEEIEAVGEMFDPAVHEAVAELPVTEGETGRVTEVHEKGYRYKGVVIRPSRVLVARRVERQ